MPFPNLQYGSQTGRGELDEHPKRLKLEIDVNSTVRALPDEFACNVAKPCRHSGIAATVGQLGHRIEHASGTRANIPLTFRPDLNQMFAIGNQIKGEISGIEGLVDVNVDQQVDIPQIQLKANRDMLAAYGIPVGSFNEFIDVAFGGEKLADIYEGQRRFDLVLKLNHRYTESIEGIGVALIDTYNGGKVPLSEVAQIQSVSGPSSISRENAQRKVVVSANVADNMSSVVTIFKIGVNSHIPCRGIQV